MSLILRNPATMPRLKKPVPPPYDPDPPVPGDKYILYGYLYNWHAVNTGNLAPTGWRVPSNTDWLTLILYLVASYLPITLNNVGRVLKSERTVGRGGIADGDHPRWEAHGTNFGTNAYNFSAVPGGFRYDDGSFRLLGSFARLWSATASFPGALYRSLLSSNAGVFSIEGDKGDGNSVRCVRDATVIEELLDDGDYVNDATDEDGNTYKTVKIGTQVWMVQNLATTKYNNGNNIPNLTGNSAWENDTAGAYCAYENDEAWAFTNTDWL